MNTIETIVQLIYELTERDDIQINKSLAKQLHEIDFTRLVLYIEEYFWLELTDEILREYDTVQKLAEFIDADTMNQIN